MNGNRLYTGNVYVNFGFKEDGKHDIKLSERDVLLINVGNKYIRADYINNKYDLISLFTILKYCSMNNDTPICDYMYSTKVTDSVFVDKNSLMNLFDDKVKLNYNDFKRISTYFDYSKIHGIYKIKRVLKKRYQNKI